MRKREAADLFVCPQPARIEPVPAGVPIEPVWRYLMIARRYEDGEAPAGIL